MYIKLGSICPHPQGFGYREITLNKCEGLNKEEATCSLCYLVGEENPCEGFNVATLPLIQLVSFLTALVPLAKEANFNHLSTEAKETLDEIERQLQDD